MNTRHLRIALIATAATLGLCQVAQANSISPYRYLWPGVLSFSLAYAFPASVLAAFIERPFLTAAGFKHRPLVLSLRVNFWSTIAGIVLGPFLFVFFSVFGPFMLLVAIAISCTIEIGLLRVFSKQAFSRQWVIAGNIISAVTLMIIPTVGIAISEAYPDLAWSLWLYSGPILFTAIAGSTGVFLASFFWRVDRVPEGGEIDSASKTLDPEGEMPPSVEVETRG